MTNDELKSRIRIMLPDVYSDREQPVEPVPMRSASLLYQDGKVAWNEIWRSFCDLAMAGGPPHRGRLLQAAASNEVAVAVGEYAEVVQEICRGIHLVTGLYAEASPAPGWVQMYCTSAVMADWLSRAITMENVSAHRRGLVLSLPAGPAFRVDKEIKNVITAVAKTAHYWSDHTSEERQGTIAALFASMNAEAVLVQPALRSESQLVAPREEMEDSLHSLTSLPTVRNPHSAWIGCDCPTVAFAITLMRSLVACNMLARREEMSVFVPLPPDDRASIASFLKQYGQAFHYTQAQCCS